MGKKGRTREIYGTDFSHYFVCGTTGSGKTVTLSNFINTAIKKDYPLLFVDGKGDIGKDSALDIVNKLNTTNKKVYVIDMNNPNTSTKYNPFKNATSTIIKDMLINLSDWTEEHYKLNAERYIQKLVSSLKLINDELDFETIVKYLPTKKFVELSSLLLREDYISKDIHITNVELADTCGKIAEDSFARFSTLLESDIGEIFKGNDGVDILTAIQEKAIILFILDPLCYSEIAPRLGRLILIDSKKAVNRLYTSNTGQKFFIFDEMNVYASSVLLNLLNKSRSANVTCICACQSLSDLDYEVNADFRWLVIENTNNYIIQKQNTPQNAEIWASVIGTRDSIHISHQVNNQAFGATETGKSSVSRSKEFLYHPDIIKTLQKGEAIFLSKSDNIHAKFTVHKPF